VTNELLGGLEAEILALQGKRTEHGMLSTFEVRVPGTEFVSGVVSADYVQDADTDNCIWDIQVAYVRNVGEASLDVLQDEDAASDIKRRLMQKLRGDSV